MFNLFAIAILERLNGRKTAAMLGEISGISERTWRNRAKRHWIPSENERRALQARVTAEISERMICIGEWSNNEATEILANVPSTKANVFLPTADLVYWNSPSHGTDYRNTISLATRFDHDCARLNAALETRDLGAVRIVLIDMLEWLESFVPPNGESAHAAQLRVQFDAKFIDCHDLDALITAAKPLHDALVLHILSCWDVEFCAGYFGAGMQAHPLFQLVMPRFAPDIEFHPETGRLLRKGRQPRTRIYESATGRYIDFIAVLTAWQRRGRLPASIPRVKDFAAWSNQNEKCLVSWRDETTRFTVRQLNDIWLAAMKPDKHGIYPGVPMPLFVCAHLWSPLLLRENGRATGILDCSGDYHVWWGKNRDRLMANGLQFGAQAWPEYLAA